jgi:hypothetical protein
VDLVRGLIPELAPEGAAGFADATGTVHVGALVSFDCGAAQVFAETGVPSVGIHGCTFVFQNGAATTTFKGSVGAYVILPGQPDATAAGTPPATTTIVQYKEAYDFAYVAGVVPQIATPFALNDQNALERWADGLLNASESGNRPNAGDAGTNDDNVVNTIDSVGLCSAEDDSNIEVPPGAGTAICITYSGSDRYDGWVALDVDVQNGKVTGVKSFTSGGNF